MVIVAAGRSTVAGAEVQRGVGAGVAVAIEAGNEVELEVVVEKLTKNVTEEHLREIFGAYGDIQNVNMPVNPQFMINRGTAYIVYQNPSDAATAIAHMHEAQLDGAVINVSIVLPRRKFSRSPPPARLPNHGPDRYGNRGPPPRSGYRGPPPPLGGGPGPGRYRSPPPYRRSPPRRFGRPEPRGRDPDQIKILHVTISIPVSATTTRWRRRRRRRRLWWSTTRQSTEEPRTAQKPKLQQLQQLQRSQPEPQSRRGPTEVKRFC
ncbi:MAG: hypothetical protein M1815_005798 [Lichina confinis]|nr:MAG: hypothetical protein M1815_005798 [Lichina confinis]